MTDTQSPPRSHRPLAVNPARELVNNVLLSAALRGSHLPRPYSRVAQCDYVSIVKTFPNAWITQPNSFSLQSPSPFLASMPEQTASNHIGSQSLQGGDSGGATDRPVVAARGLSSAHLQGYLFRHQPAAQIALIPPARSGPSWHDSARESRPQRTPPLRQREKVQALPRRRGRRAGTCGWSRRRVLRLRVPRWNCVPDASAAAASAQSCLTVRYPPRPPRRFAPSCHARTHDERRTTHSTLAARPRTG
jgi:hypothetical protein